MQDFADWLDAAQSILRRRLSDLPSPATVDQCIAEHYWQSGIGPWGYVADIENATLLDASR